MRGELTPDIKLRTGYERDERRRKEWSTLNEMLASDANHPSDSGAKLSVFSSGDTEAHAGLRCDSCGNTNDTQIE